MRKRLMLSLLVVLPLIAAGAVTSDVFAQGQTDRFSRTLELQRNGSVAVSNVSGEITVVAGAGDDVVIDATKRTTGDRSELDRVQIRVDERPDRISVTTEYPRARRNQVRGVSVDYTVTVPSWASIDVRSVSGSIRVTGVQGAVRARSVSGDVSTSNTPGIEFAETVSGNIDISGAAGAAGQRDLQANSVSGDVRARALKVRSLDAHTVSGNVTLTDIACDRLSAKSVSGDLDYVGTIVPTGRYTIDSHSGTVRFTPTGTTGFAVEGETFSGRIRFNMPLTVHGDVGGTRSRRGQSVRAKSGDGSALILLHTFSGSIVVGK